MPPVKRLLIGLAGLLFHSLGVAEPALQDLPPEAPLTPATAEGEGVPVAPLTVLSWGGAYHAAQRAAYFEPFTAATGIPLEFVPYDGGLAPLQAHLATGEPKWDVLDLAVDDAASACAAGLLAELNPAIIAPAPDGTPAAEDFLPGALQPCAISHLLYATVIVYDERAFPGEKPQRLADFFDLERFPGDRALRQAPVGLFEWSLLSYGVPRSQIYDLLSTERGLRLVFRRLDSLGERLRWWVSGDEPIDLLLSGEVTMASAYNGRVFAAQNDGAPLTVVWDGQLLDANAWAILADNPDRERAEQFIRFATTAESMAALATHIPYGPTRHSAEARIGRHPDSGVPMPVYLPTAPRHLRQGLWQDHEWYTRTRELRERWFGEWLGEQ